MDSLVLDIQRSSFHDGPGVRTTVFLKGCPLHCPWCHNPESQSFTRELSCNLSRCTHCGACAAVCGEGVHRFRDGAHAVDFFRCQHCGGCVGACPSGALTLFGGSMSAEEVFSIVRRDKVFYDSTGGGVTLSGGEPLSHPDFCADLLTLCKQAGISTCLETSGFASGKTLSRLLNRALRVHRRLRIIRSLRRLILRLRRLIVLRRLILRLLRSLLIVIRILLIIHDETS